MTISWEIHQHNKNHTIREHGTDRPEEHPGDFERCQQVRCRLARSERRDPSAIEMMSPRQHYAMATKLLDSVDKLPNREGITDPIAAQGYLAQVATAHAILATVPQAQFDAWKPGPDQSPTPDRRSWNCSLCGRLLFETDADDRLYQAADCPGWMSDRTGVTCRADDPNGCRGLGPAIRPRRPTVLPSGHVSCRHGRARSRCYQCNSGNPVTICNACSVPCWSGERMIGSRCDLPGCDGALIRYDGRNYVPAPIEVNR